MDVPGNRVTSAKQNHRRWFQFRLRTLLVVTVLCGCLMGWVAWERQKSANHQAVLAAIRARGGTVSFYSGQKSRSKWLQFVLGSDSSDLFCYVFLDGSAITDETLDLLNELPNIQELCQATHGRRRTLRPHENP